MKKGGSGVNERPIGLRMQGLPLQRVGEEQCCYAKEPRVLPAGV